LNQKHREIYLKPFGIAYGKIYVGDLNLDVAGTGFTRCRYGTIAKKKPKPLKSKPKKKRKGLLFQ